MGEIEFDSRALLQELKSHQAIFLNWGVMKVILCERHLAMRVNGLRFKGWVVITATQWGTFMIEFLSTHGNLKYSFDNIRFKHVVMTIENRITHIPAYMDKLPEIDVEVEEQFDEE